MLQNKIRVIKYNKIITNCDLELLNIFEGKRLC